jgi:MFS family permease
MSSLLFFASFNMIIPELNDYLVSLDGAEYKGLIIALFTLTAMASRPFSAKIADSVGRIYVMVIGLGFCVVISFLYPIVTSLAGFLALRLVHGFSTGFTPTGATALVSDIIPKNRRGEAMGILGTAGSVGMAAGLAIGPSLANDFGLNVMFYTSSATALLSVLILFGVRETLSKRQKISIRVLKVHKRELFEPRVIIPCVVMLLTVYAYGAIFTLTSDQCAFLGIENKGLPFVFLTLSSLSIRLIAGKASDLYGRKIIVIISSLVIALSMILLAVADTPLMMFIAMSVYGLGQGMTSPTLLAWATDLSIEKYKGRGIASLYIFMELGIFFGAILSGFIYANDPANFFIAFFTCSLLSLAAFVYLIFLKTPKVARTHELTEPIIEPI